MSLNCSSLTFYHLCSAGNRTDLLFSDRDEFISGMNLVAIAALKNHARIAAFCLMSNHFHFLLSAVSDEEVVAFASHISQLYNRRIRHVEGQHIPIRWSYFKVDSSDYLKSVLVYILKNPVNASYRCMPMSYPWSSAGLYFSDNWETSSFGQNPYKTMKALGKTRVLHLLHSKCSLPDSWLMTPAGFVWPGSYIDYHQVENFFGRGVREFLYYLSAVKKEDVQNDLNRPLKICIPDQEMKIHALELCESTYHHRSLTQLKLSERQHLQKLLTFQYGCSDKQLARILHLSIHTDL